MQDNDDKQFRNWHRIEQIASIVFIVLIVLGCFVVLKPFVTAIMWAAILCFVTWPLYQRLNKACRGRKTLAAGIMTLIIMLVLVLPFSFAGITFVHDVRHVAQQLNSYRHEGVPAPPAWLPKVPVLGNYLQNYWADLSENTDQAAATLTRLINKFMPIAFRWGIALIDGIFQLLLSVMISFFLYRNGPTVVSYVSDGIKQIAGDYGVRVFVTVGQTIKSVVYGLLGTALAQGIMAGIGFTIVGLPAALLWALVTFFLSLIPFGPLFVWVPAVVWIFVKGEVGFGVFLAIWGIISMSGIDNVIRPLLISKGSSLPFVLTLLGVLGGLAAFGFIGIFLGPTLLAAGYSLIHEFMRRGQETNGTAAAAGPVE